LRTRSTPNGGRWRRADSGSSSAELVLVIPAMFLVIALALQLVFWALASHASLAAAASGGDVARASGSSAAAGIATASEELAALAGGLVLDPYVSAFAATGGNDIVTVGGGVPSVFPGLRLRVGASVIGPQAEFRGSG
jgi:expansin (peptidoglycan-binding protein)